jgi:hypothetical protein
MGTTSGEPSHGCRWRDRWTGDLATHGFRSSVPASPLRRLAAALRRQRSGNDSLVLIHVGMGEICSAAGRCRRRGRQCADRRGPAPRRFSSNSSRRGPLRHVGSRRATTFWRSHVGNSSRRHASPLGGAADPVRLGKCHPSVPNRTVPSRFTPPERSSFKPMHLQLRLTP